MEEMSLYQVYLKLLGEEKIPSFLRKYLSISSLVRLKKIGYFCGMDYASKHIYEFKEKISRYDHSLTVALLTWMFTQDKKSTIAGLFHDISTPCFSHVIDYMNKDYEFQESTEEYTKKILESDEILKEYLSRDGIDIEEIIDFKKYSIVDTPRPKLCADRLDGIILTGIAWTKNIGKSDIIEIIEDLKVYKNEDSELELGFETEDVAIKVLNVSDEIDKFCRTNEDNFMMELLASITSLAIKNKIINYEELYYINETTLLAKIKNSKINELEKLFTTFETITKEEIPITIIEGLKVRDLNPLVRGIRLKK